MVLAIATGLGAVVEIECARELERGLDGGGGAHGFFELDVGLVEGLTVVDHVFVDLAGFGEPDAVLAPFRVSHVGDEVVLGVGFRLKFLGVFGDEGVQDFRVSLARTRVSARSPWRSPLRELAALPSGVTGPREREPLAREAACCFSVRSVPFGSMGVELLSGTNV